MPGTGNRQKFGNAFDDAKNQGVDKLLHDGTWFGLATL
jgi:hypothetical protein